MNDESPAAAEQYLVVRNHELQYSIWRADRELPAGWESVDEAAPKEQCLSRIEELWTDMRPLSLRTLMEEQDA